MAAFGRYSSVHFKPDTRGDLFFDGVLTKAHRGKVNRLLTRERLIRSAYLVYYRQALAEYFVARGQAKNIAEAEGKIERADEEDIDQGDDN